jgi:hypothetical protein
MEAGLKVVDAVFDPEILPNSFFKYRDKFYVSRCLSLFRTMEIGGEFEKAEEYYRLAIKKSVRGLWRWPYLKRYLRMKFRLLYHGFY